MGRVEMFGVLVAILDDEIIVKDWDVSLQLQLKSPAVAEEIQSDFVLVLGQRAFVPEMLRVDALRLVVKQFMVIHVLTQRIQTYNNNNID